MLYFKDCIGRKIVRPKNDPEKHRFTQGIYRILTGEMRHGDYCYQGYQIKSGAKEHDCTTSSVWDDGLWELYEDGKDINGTIMAEGYNVYIPTNIKEEKSTMGNRRIVNITVIDKDSNVSIEDAILYHETHVPTDMTDEEIWFDIKLDALIKKHNNKRFSIKDSNEARLKPITMETVGRNITTVIVIKEV